MPPPDITGPQILAALGYGNWSGGAGLVLTYSVPGAGAVWSAYGGPDSNEPSDPEYHVLTGAQGAAFGAAMELYDSLLGATFNPVSDATPGAIRIAWSNLHDTNTWGYAYLAEPNTSASDTGLAGDIWLNTQVVDADTTFAQGSYDWMALMHEMGHALGLQHTFDSATNPIPVQFDNYRYSIMSYTPQQDAWNWVISETPTGIVADAHGVYAITPMLFDIYTLQNRYGADPNTRSGATTYTFDPTLAALQTIYDAGGTDTWDLSGHARPSIIDLTPGSFSSIDYYSQAQQVADNDAVWGPGYHDFFVDVYDDPDVYHWQNNVAIAYNTTIENVILGNAADSVIGNDANNAFTGNGGNDTLMGGAGADTLMGGAGADSLDGGAGIFDVASYATSGTAVSINLFTATYSGGDAVGDSLVNMEGAIGSAFADTLIGDNNGNYFTGGGGADTLNGGVGNDVLDGGAGVDSMTGGDGSDTYYVDSVGDVVVEFSGDTGEDTIISSIGVGALTANVENLELAGAAANAVGNTLNNRITGNALNNILDGGGGQDSLYGGAGNDIYYLDNVFDKIFESAGAGTDTAFYTVSMTAGLDANVENVTLSGAALNAQGNGLNNVITGNSNANVLNGGAGEDTLNGGFGNDTLLYNSVGDVISDTGGIDTVLAYIDLPTLMADIENLTLAGSAIIGGGNGLNNNIIGNSLANNLSGGAGNDSLNGSVGADTMSGGVGDDGYLVENSNDLVVENAGEGTDIIYAFISISALAANVEKLTLMPAGGTIDGTANGLDNRLNGNDSNNVLTALGGADVIQGLGGDDRIIGGAGLDNIFGGTGNDVFVYQATSDSGVTGATRDLINDFTQGSDTIDLSAIDAISGGGDNAFSLIGAGAFTHTAGQLRYDLIDASGTANDFTVIGMDVNGDGVADSQITLRGLITLTTADFVL